MNNNNTGLLQSSPILKIKTAHTADVLQRFSHFRVLGNYLCENKHVMTPSTKTSPKSILGTDYFGVFRSSVKMPLKGSGKGQQQKTEHQVI